MQKILQVLGHLTGGDSRLFLFISLEVEFRKTENQDLSPEFKRFYCEKNQKSGLKKLTPEVP